MDKYDYLIVGAGLFGSVFAQQAKEKGYRCLVIDKRPHVGGNLYCNNNDGIDVHIYGAHIFHTDIEHVWNYAGRFTRFNHFRNSPLAYYQNQLYNLPFNMNTFRQLWGVKTPAEARLKIEEQRSKFAHIKTPANFEEQALILCGEDIYYAFIREYTEKQWGRKTTLLPAFIIKRIPLRFTYDNNYFHDPYQGIPKNGYNNFINNLLHGIEVRCNINYFEDRRYFDEMAKRILFTGCLDEFFHYKYGKLEYRSLRFEHERLDIEDFQGNAVVNYPEAIYPYTRIIEHKHFTFGKQPFTVITKEYPKTFENGDEPFYPINDEYNMKLLAQYQAEADRLSPKVLFGGRLAQYAYFDMDDTIAASLELFKGKGFIDDDSVN